VCTDCILFRTFSTTHPLNIASATCSFTALLKLSLLELRALNAHISKSSGTLFSTTSLQISPPIPTKFHWLCLRVAVRCSSPSMTSTTSLAKTLSSLRWTELKGASPPKTITKLLGAGYSNLYNFADSGDHCD
jgi:hypothetical protein